MHPDADALKDEALATLVQKGDTEQYGILARRYEKKCNELDQTM